MSKAAGEISPRIRLRWAADTVSRVRVGAWFVAAVWCGSRFRVLGA